MSELSNELFVMRERRKFEAQVLDFNGFWILYPRKVGRMKAERCWKKMGVKEQDLAVYGLKLWKQTAQWHQADGQFIPYASTFLAQKRYLDEPWTGAFEGR
jgi:hypothetical protein